jgi:hypothetical protein
LAKISELKGAKQKYTGVFQHQDKNHQLLGSQKRLYLSCLEQNLQQIDFLKVSILDHQHKFLLLGAQPLYASALHLLLPKFYFYQFVFSCIGRKAKVKISFTQLSCSVLPLFYLP